MIYFDNRLITAVLLTLFLYSCSEDSIIAMPDLPVIDLIDDKYEW